MRHITALILLITGMLAGCGGGSGGGATAPPITTSVVNGTAAKGPIRGGIVKAYAIVNGLESRSVALGQAQTDGNGAFTLDAGAYTGPVVLEISGGSYTDELSGATVTLKSPLRTLLANIVVGSQTAAVTPLTELAYKLAQGTGALTPAAISAANSTIAAYFKLAEIVTSLPLAGTGDDNQKKYAFILGAFSQMAHDNKNAGETLDDAIARLITRIGDELKNNCGISTATLTQFNAAVAAFASGGKNLTGASITPLASPTSGLLKLGTAGTAGTIGAIDVTIHLPAGITVNADALTGETSAGVVTVSGVAASGSNRLASAKYTAAAGATPAQLHIVAINAAGFGLGEFVTIRFNLDAGTNFPATASDFTVAVFSAFGLSGTALTSITATPLSVALALN